MVFNTLTVGAAVTPSVIETYFSHYLNRGPLKQKPTAHIGYHEGLRLIRQFLDYSSKHTIEDLQGFTAQYVPTPTWVRINDAEVAPKFLERAAKLLQDQLGQKGIDQIGGKTWWQWRRAEEPLRAEWIEMKKEYHERKRTGDKCERVMLYVHGGAYYFGSVDEHRYQMQRHARKLRARVLSPRYRLAPQFPFPCGLFDCLATYYYLLEHFDPSQILFAGDSAGGGMILSMLVTLRDQGQPLPAGTILLSPWVDLTHSFPSVAGDGAGDYIPPHGFHHKPSMAWPPPPSDEIKKSSGNYGAPSDAVELPATAGLDMKRKRRRAGEEDEDTASVKALSKAKSQEALTALPSIGNNLKIMIDGKSVEMKEQFQMYTTNELLAHPLVSPVMQPSLGGLPPMLIQVGGAELLQDEQLYLAHKAANPKGYPPNDTVMDEYDPQRRTLEKYPPTDVQVQLWDDLCHVAPTLSFTRPAKYMYRSVAQFGAWALSHAQQKGIDIQNDDAVSIISSVGEDEDEGEDSSLKKDGSNGSTLQLERVNTNQLNKMGAVGKAGDPLPPFKNNMIRQRVTRHGIIYPMAPPSEIAGLSLDPGSIGVIKPGPVRKWLAVHKANEQRFANEKKKIQKKKAKEEAAGYDTIEGEHPPPTALVNRVRKGVAPEEKKKGRSWGLAMWSGWGSSHDEHTLQREQKQKKGDEAGDTKAAPDGSQTAAGKLAARSAGDGDGGSRKRRTSSVSAMSAMPWSKENRTRSPYQEVQDTGQAGDRPGTPRAASRNQLNGSPARTVPSALSRRTSGSGSMLVSRPISMADSPIPVTEQQQRGRSDTGAAGKEVMPPRDLTTPVPTTSAVQPDSEKIPGSENTYLSPSSSRPHNGVVAYPFKLREKASNPSIATLDSARPSAQPSGAATPANEPSGFHSELVGDSPARIELPVAAESKQEPVDSPVAQEIGDSRKASSSTSAASPVAAPESTVQSPKKEEEAVIIPRKEEEIVSPIEGSTAKLSEDPISPVGDTPTAGQQQSSKVPFKVRNTIFDPRTSMLGSIGADGMPNAHHNFTRDQSPEPKQPTLPENIPPPPQPTATKESSGPAEGTKDLPFKLRHTVYEPNVTLGKPTDEPSIPELNPAAAGAKTETENLAPKRQPSSRASEAPEAVITHQPSAITNPAYRESGVLGILGDAPPSYDSMPTTNVTMPETVAQRPIVQREKTPVSPIEGNDEDEVPPPPPPKDAKHVANRKPTGLRKGSGGVKTNGMMKSSRENLKSNAPTSKFAAVPSLGKLGFEGEKKDEQQRPVLESFVTASEGRELKK